MNRHEARFVELQAVSDGGVLQGCGAGRHVERAGDELTGFHGAQQGVDSAGSVQRLQHELQRATARQPKAMRFFSADAVFDGFGLGVMQAFAAHAVDEVVFNAAARDRADDDTVIAQREHRAFGPRRRTPRFDYRDEQHAPPLF